MKKKKVLIYATLVLLPFLTSCSSRVVVESSTNDDQNQAIAEQSSYPTPAMTLSKLIADLSSDDPNVRVVSAYALEKYGDKAVSAIPQLVDNLYFDNYSRVRTSAAIALGIFGNLAQEAVPDLTYVIENDPAPGVVFVAIEALGLIGDANAVPLLASILFCDSRIYEGRFYTEEGCHTLAIESAEAITKLTGESFKDAGTGIYILNDEGIPFIILDAREWWDSEGKYQDWSTNRTGD